MWELIGNFCEVISKQNSDSIVNSWTECLLHKLSRSLVFLLMKARDTGEDVLSLSQML